MSLRNSRLNASGSYSARIRNALGQGDFQFLFPGRWQGELQDLVQVLEAFVGTFLLISLQIGR